MEKRINIFSEKKRNFTPFLQSVENLADSDVGWRDNCRCLRQILVPGAALCKALTGSSAEGKDFIP